MALKWQGPASKVANHYHPRQAGALGHVERQMHSLALMKQDRWWWSTERQAQMQTPCRLARVEGRDWLLLWARLLAQVVESSLVAMSCGVWCLVVQSAAVSSLVGARHS